jgi:hypothetical protein
VNKQLSDLIKNARRQAQRKAKKEGDKAPNDGEVASWASGYIEGFNFLAEKLEDKQRSKR